jgi:hypothetical protein
MYKRMKRYIGILKHIASDYKMGLNPIAKTGYQEIWFMRNEVKDGCPNILVAAGFHGDEGGGPAGVIKFLQELYQKVEPLVNLSILPVVNPVAYNRCSHNAERRSNCGFIHNINDDKLSDASQKLIKATHFLAPLASEGFLTLHENTSEDKGFFLYSFEKDQSPSLLIRSLRNVGATYYGMPPDGTKIYDDHDTTTEIKFGIVHNLHDGSYEDFLFHMGSRRCIATEVPAKFNRMRYNTLKYRSLVNAKLIFEFIALSIEEAAYDRKYDPAVLTALKETISRDAE